jgi:hypothetical protein
VENAWTGYNPSLGRSLLNSSKFLDPKNAEEKKSSSASASEAVPSADDKTKF